MFCTRDDAWVGLSILWLDWVCSLGLIEFGSRLGLGLNPGFSIDVIVENWQWILGIGLAWF